MLNYKRPKFWVTVLSIVIVIIIGIGLMSNPKIAGIVKGTDKSTDKIVKEDVISLQFEKYVADNDITIIDKNKVSEIIQQYTIDDYKYIIFVHEDDTDNLHSGVIISDKIYDFQKVSMMGNKNNTDLFSINKITLYEKQFVKIQGMLGANYAPTNYYYIENKSPQLFLHSEGHTMEVDLDNDGTEEIISTIPGGATADIDIYKYYNGNLSVVNLNEILNAITVIYNQYGKTFEAYFQDKPNQPKYYEFTQEGLKELITE